MQTRPYLMSGTGGAIIAAAAAGECPYTRGDPISADQNCTMRVELIDHFDPCMADIYLHI